MTMPITSEFSFQVPVKTNTQSWRHHLPPISPESQIHSSPSFALATSTPPAPSSKRSSLVTSKAEPPRQSQGLFKFHHDEETRQRLQDIVTAMEGVATPPRETSVSRGDIDAALWRDNIDQLRKSIPFAHQREQGYDENERLTNTRSTKRVRLSMSEYRRPMQASVRADRLGNSVATPHTQRRLERLAQSARRATTPRRPTYARPLPTSAGKAGDFTSLRAVPPSPMPVQPLSRRTVENDPQLNPVVADKLQEAKALMERLRVRSEDKGKGPAVLSENADQQAIRQTRPPLLRSTAKSMQDISPTPGPSRTVQRLAIPDIITPEDERQDVLAPLPQINAASVSIRQHLAVSMRQVSTSSNGSLQDSKRSLASAPLVRLPMNRPPSSLSSHTSSDKFFTSTSTRVPSTSTAATSLISSLKSTKPPSILASRGVVHVTAELAKEFLSPDILGDMVFDEINKRWIKSTTVRHVSETRSSPLGQLSVIEEADKESVNGAEVQEDDPFRDMTSLDISKMSEGGDASNRHRRSGSLTFTYREEKSVAHTEQTSTPPMHDEHEAPPLISPDLPAIPEQPSSGAVSREQAETQQRKSLQDSSTSSSSHLSVPKTAPKSAMKSRSKSESLFTPLALNRTAQGDRSKLCRSVSFSDGRTAGKIMQRTNIHTSKLKEEVRVATTSTENSAVEDSSDDSGNSNSASGEIEVAQRKRLSQTPFPKQPTETQHTSQPARELQLSGKSNVIAKTPFFR